MFTSFQGYNTLLGDSARFKMIADTINTSERIQIESEQQLDSAFVECRKGPYGAFNFFHAHLYPWLSVLINESAAYVHYFPDEEGHPGFHSIADASTEPAEATLHFLQPGGDEASSFEISTSMTVSIDAALSAAKQVLATPALPTCIRWQEL